MYGTYLTLMKNKNRTFFLSMNLHLHCFRILFQELQRRVTTEALESLFEYVESTWMGDGLWSPQAWSTFGQPVRTNNDVEGWHHRLNAKAGANLNFYSVLGLLHAEASLITLQVSIFIS